MNDRFKLRVFDDGNMYYGVESGCVRFLGGQGLTLEELNDTYELMQCTGLKDKNGTLIYEGDILRHNDEDRIHVVMWGEIDTSDWCNEKTSGNHCHGWGIEYADCVNIDDKYQIGLSELLDEEYHDEVIGNIYENPELMGGK